MSNTYNERSLIYGVREHGIIQEFQKCRKCEVGDIGSVNRNTARKCIHEWETQEGRVREVQ